MLVATSVPTIYGPNEETISLETHFFTAAYDLLNVGGSCVQCLQSQVQ